MTAPDTRDSVERIVAEMREAASATSDRYEAQSLRKFARRLSALPQQAGGEDAQRWRLNPGGGIVTDHGGEYVEYTDYAALQAEVARRTDSVIVVGATALACSSAVKEMFGLMRQRVEAAEAALREAHTLPETWRNKWDGGCCCDAAGQECADALDAAIGGTGDA